MSAGVDLDERFVRALPKAGCTCTARGAFSLLDLPTLAEENGAAPPGPAASLFDIDPRATVGRARALGHRAGA